MTPLWAITLERQSLVSKLPFLLSSFTTQIISQKTGSPEPAVIPWFNLQGLLLHSGSNKGSMASGEGLQSVIPLLLLSPLHYHPSGCPCSGDGKALKWHEKTFQKPCSRALPAEVPQQCLQTFGRCDNCLWEDSSGGQFWNLLSAAGQITARKRKLSFPTPWNRFYLFYSTPFYPILFYFPNVKNFNVKLSEEDIQDELLWPWTKWWLLKYDNRLQATN